MDNNGFQPSPLLTTNRSAGNGSNIPPPPRNNNNNPKMRKTNKHSNHISKPITKSNVSNNNNTNPQNVLTEVQTPLPPSLYTITIGEFKDFVQKVTGATPDITAPPPINKPKPISTRLQNIRPPPLMPINNHLSVPLDTGFVNPGYPFNPFNAMNPINDFNDGFVVTQYQPSPPLPPFPTVSMGNVESPVTKHLRIFRESMMSSSMPVFSHGIIP